MRIEYVAAIAIAAVAAGTGLAVHSVSSPPTQKAVHACRCPIGDPVSSVRGSVFASVRWLTAGATPNALAALPE